MMAHNSEIEWSGVAWTCVKQLKHFPAFRRNGALIKVCSFVYIMAEGKSNYIGYLEDMFEDKNGEKKVQVRWFHHSWESEGVISQLGSHPNGILYTSYAQVISAECMDGPATVFTLTHYNKFVSIASQTLGVHVCYRQFKNGKVKPFMITNLRGCSKQAIFFSMGGFITLVKDKEKLTRDDPPRATRKKKRTSKRQPRLVSATGERSEPIYP